MDHGTDWNTALRDVAEIFTFILNAHGPQAIAFYGSGQLDCTSTDSNSRCHTTVYSPSACSSARRMTAAFGVTPVQYSTPTTP